MPSYQPVIALVRGLEILKVVNELKQASVKAINERTGLDKATIVRMLETLEHEGYVARHTDQPLYGPTGRTLLLSQGYDRHRWIGSVAEPILNAFRNRIGWPSDMAICDRDSMVVVQTSRGQGSLSFNRGPGFRAPVLGTSLGRAYLAFCDEAERQRILEAIGPSPGPWNEIARHPRKLKALIDGIRQQGYAVMDDTYSQAAYGGTVWAFAVPVMREGDVHGSLNIMLLKSAVVPEDGIARLLAPLQETAERVAEALAGPEAARTR